MPPVAVVGRYTTFLTARTGTRGEGAGNINVEVPFVLTPARPDWGAWWAINDNTSQTNLNFCCSPALPHTFPTMAPNASNTSLEIQRVSIEILVRCLDQGCMV